jgi:hypothetical protein
VPPTFTFSAPLWEYSGKAAWYFVTLPIEQADDIEALATPKGGFGSVKVDVTVGETIWSTSLFPDNGAGSYVLPIKRAVRDAEGIDIGDTVDIELRLADNDS